MRKKSMFVVSWVIYPFDVLVCLGVTKDEVIKAIRKDGYKLNLDEIEAIEMHGEGRTVMLEGGQTVLWLKDVPKKGSGLLAHEICHAVHFLFRRIGIRLSDDSDEAYAYATQYLTSRITNLL